MLPPDYPGEAPLDRPPCLDISSHIIIIAIDKEFPGKNDPYTC